MERICTECAAAFMAKKNAWTCSAPCRQRRARRLKAGRPAPLAAETETVYFIAGVLPGVEGFVNGLVKIGKSVSRTGARVQEHQSGSPAELKLLRTVAGPPGFERALHRHFAAERRPQEWCGTEWFDLSARLQQLVFRMNDNQVRITAATAVLPEEWSAWLSERDA